MNETIIKERFRNAVNAFFEDEKLDKNTALNSTSFSEVIQSESHSIFSDKGDTLIKIIKQVFIFLPGAFLLFFISMGTMLDFIYFWLHPEIVPIRSQDWYLQIFLVYLTAFASIFMTWFGLGNIKEWKHFAIPASIITIGIIIGSFIGLTAEMFTFSEKILRDFGLAILLFPLGLIVPVLAKGLVDRKREDA